MPKWARGVKDRCYINGCDRAVTARGLCITHYGRQMRSGSALNPVPDTPKPWTTHLKGKGMSK